MTNNCARCGKPFDSWLHPCISRATVVHLDKYFEQKEQMRHGNPLDRLTVADWIQIDGKDVEEERRRTQAMLDASERAYFEEPLTYRVEVQDLSGTGFRGAFDYNSIVCNSADESEFERVLDYLFSGQSFLPLLRLDTRQVYLCRLVSLNREGIRYVWIVKKLAYDEKWRLFDLIP